MSDPDLNPRAAGDQAWNEQPRGRTGNRQPPNAPLWIDDEEWDEAELPVRAWIARKYAHRGSVTLLVGPPSAMKSSLMLAWAAALALNVPHGDFGPTAAGTTVVYNVEDDRTEQRRRLSAVLRQFNTTPAAVSGKIVRVGPAAIGTLFSQNGGGIINTSAMDCLRDLIRERHADLLIADPLAELHDCDENDNTALRAVLAAFRSLAIECNIAIILVHHTRKGTVNPGDPDSARGASASVGATRITLTVITMPEDDARLFGLPTSRQARSNYIRLDDAKQNYAGIGDGEWYEKVVYRLENGEAVPAAEPWQPPNIWKQISTFSANEILDELDRGLPEGRRYSRAPQAKDRAAWPVVQNIVPTLNEEQAKKVIADWVKNQVIEARQYHDPEARREISGLFVNSAKRPGTSA